jgi:hypothetical protein
MKLVWVLLAGVALAGCKLVDQTTFAPTPEADPVPLVPAASTASQADPRKPLLTIGYATPDPNYQEVLRYAVHTAETRARGVQYDVVAMMPAGGDAAQAQGNAVEVMRTILAQGVPQSRIHLGLRVAPAGVAREVRVYVR